MNKRAGVVGVLFVLSTVTLQASAQTMPPLCVEHLRVANICAADLDAATVKSGIENQNIKESVQSFEAEIFNSVRPYGERSQELLDRACMPNAFIHLQLVNIVSKTLVGLQLTKGMTDQCWSSVEALEKRDWQAPN